MNFLPLLLCSEKEITRQTIDKVLKEVETDHIHHVLVKPEKIVNTIHLIQALSVCLRNRRVGIKIAKKVEIDIICYICCTDNIKRALDECVDDLGRCVLIVTFSDDHCDLDRLKEEQMRLVKNIVKINNIENIDLTYCASCYRKVNPPSSCGTSDVMEILERMVELVLDRIE
ncbi:MAG: hypothetical protein GXO23_00370 [Crenarchaeota archaeon]|nr:hypothetical protein [Thermoproteota archaeon]